MRKPYLLFAQLEETNWIACCLHNLWLGPFFENALQVHYAVKMDDFQRVFREWYRGTSNFPVIPEMTGLHGWMAGSV